MNNYSLTKTDIEKEKQKGVLKTAWRRLVPLMAEEKKPEKKEVPMGKCEGCGEVFPEIGADSRLTFTLVGERHDKKKLCPTCTTRETASKPQTKGWTSL